MHCRRDIPKGESYEKHETCPQSQNRFLCDPDGRVMSQLRESAIYQLFEHVKYDNGREPKLVYRADRRQQAARKHESGGRTVALRINPSSAASGEAVRDYGHGLSSA